ncbi:MAG: hypothetical protein ACYS9X_19855, partial [Planctomycetota bacterium]
GVFAALGVLASAWLFVPMLAPGRLPPTEPERVEMEPGHPEERPGRGRPLRIHPVHVRSHEEPEGEPEHGRDRPVPVMNRRIMLDFRKVRPVDPDAR